MAVEMQHVTKDDFRLVDVACCNACQGTSYRTLGYRGGTAHRSGAGIRTRVVACKECGLIFANPIPIPKESSLLYDTAAEEYFTHHDLSTKLELAKGMLAELERKTDGRKLLDVGCGQGTVLQAARSRGWDVMGLDVSERFAEYAKRELNVPVRVGDVAVAELEHESFDVVVVNAILEHLVDPRQVLINIHASLRAGGLLVVDVPNEKGLYYQVGNLWQKLRHRDWVVNLSPTFSPGHLYGFSPGSLRTILSQTGYDNVSINIYQGRNCLPEPRSTREALERFATTAVIRMAEVIGLGDGMTAIAVKGRNVLQEEREAFAFGKAGPGSPPSSPEGRPRDPLG